MQDAKTLIEGLTNHDDKFAYKCLTQLEQESSNSAAVYPFFDLFVEMLNHESSYIRTRGIVLIAANAQWDVDYKVDEVIDKLLRHITDDKPITARQCIKALPLLAKHKPELRQDIVRALHDANVMRYKESMQSLVAKNIQKALADIEKL